MRSEKTFRLGRVNIDGDLVEFEPETELAFDAERRDIVSVGIAYAYREASEEKEETRARFTAHVEGENSETFEAVIGDSPVRNDSRRGFVSVPIRLTRTGELRGRFLVEASYASGPWAEATPVAGTSERVEGQFVLRVR